MNGLGGIIILVIVIGGWVIKAISAANEAKQKKAGRQGQAGQPRMDYEALAERRRQELQQQAQQRRAQQARGPQTQVPQRDPASMSMAERIEMARQRSAQQRGGGPAVDRQAEALRQAQRDAEAGARVRAERARQQQAVKQRQQQQHQKQMQQQSQPPPGRAATQRAAAAKRRDMSQVSEDAKRKHQQSHDRVLSKHEARAARLQESKADKRSRGTKALLDFSKLNRRSLRQAIVLKEVLDPPVALRDNPKY